MPNPEDITDSITAMNMALSLMAKAFKLNYSTPTNNNQRISSKLRNRQIAQPGINMGQDRQMQMIGGNGGNQFRQLLRTQEFKMMEIRIRLGMGIKGVGHFARDCTIRPMRRDAAYLQTQLLIAQKEEAGIQLQAEEYDLIADAVKSTIVTLQRVVKHTMTIETHNWSSSAHQQLHKIARDENFPIVNQVDARVQNFEIQFLKEAAKFVGNFKSLANEADASLAKHKALELEIKRLLKAIVNQDIMTIVQKESVVDTSDL
nr:hypothetical protein [Tanacetum cinerariifolium]